MYDGLTARYTFRCPTATEARVRLSAFRAVERLPGVRRPAIYEVRFACPCGEEHAVLVPHDDLDWAPLGTVATAFYNVMTGRLEPAAPSLVDEAAWRISHGRWPWTFYCLAESCTRPVFPSSFRLLVPDDDRIVVAVTCPACSRTSANVVSHEHLDLPFYSDHEVDVVEHVYCEEEDMSMLADELAAGTHRCRRASLT